MLDSGSPTNCAGTGCGWMIGSSATPMVAFVTGLWIVEMHHKSALEVIT